MFKGLLPAMVTPFDEQGEVDLRTTEAVVERLVDAGVDGIVALGSNGEFSHLTTDERKRFAEEVVKIVAGRGCRRRAHCPSLLLEGWRGGAV